MSGTPLMVERGDQTLIGNDWLVDLSHFEHVTGEDGNVTSTVSVSYKVYKRVANTAYPHDSTEASTWVQAGDSYTTKDAAIMAAVNQAQG